MVNAVSAKSEKSLNGLMPDMACLPSPFLLFGRVGVEDDCVVNCRQRAEVRKDRFEILGRRLREFEPRHRGVERQRDLRGAVRGVVPILSEFGDQLIFRPFAEAGFGVRREVGADGAGVLAQVEDVAAVKGNCLAKLTAARKSTAPRLSNHVLQNRSANISQSSESTGVKIGEPLVA